MYDTVNSVLNDSFNKSTKPTSLSLYLANQGSKLVEHPSTQTPELDTVSTPDELQKTNPQLYQAL